MKKRQLKKNFARVINDVPDNLGICEYYNVEEKCYCAVGFLLKTVGVSDDKLISLDSCGASSIGSELTGKLRNAYGLSVSQLQRIISRNDHSNGDRSKVVQVMKQIKQNI